MNGNPDDSVTLRRLGTAICMMCLGALLLIAAATTIGAIFG